MVPDEPNRRSWKKILVPETLLDLFSIIAKNKGYSERDWYLFIYHLLKTAYPEDVERLDDFLNTGQFDQEK
jgi:hypothetical protein